MHPRAYIERLNAFLERMAERYEAMGMPQKAEAVRCQSIPLLFAR